MHSLIKPLSEQEKEQIGREMERLFLMQDKPFNNDKKALFVYELSTLNLPFNAIIKGIKALYDKDLKSLKLALIVESIKSFIDYDAGRMACPDCGISGCVQMRDEQGRWFALACQCSNGDSIAKAQGLTRWNGEGNQISNGRSLTLCRSSKREEINKVEMDSNVKDLCSKVSGKVVSVGS